MSEQMNGHFIVFEGLDGAGKSTLMANVVQGLAGKNTSFCRVRDPGGPSVSERLRQIILDANESPSPKTELLMYQASRAELVEKEIRPAIAAGHWVLADRFYSSTIAFQAEARGLKLEHIHWLNQFVCENTHPDLFVFIDITVDESERRIQNRTTETGVEKDRMELEKRDFHERVRRGYLRQAEESPESWLVLDGSKTPEALYEDVWSYIEGKSWLG